MIVSFAGIMPRIVAEKMSEPTGRQVIVENCAGAEGINAAVAAPDGMLCFTDWRHASITGQMLNDGQFVDRFVELFDDDAVRHKIFVHNPARLCAFA
jgi:predicted TIM-barrel fold metal-dependent hydrolase